MSESSQARDGAGRGKLKIFLGYAAGVGKTYQMLLEAQTLRTRGVDVVIGYFEPHARLETIAQTEGLETVPRRRATYRDATFEDMDTDAVLRRHPQVCVVDEFAHSNIPGSPRAKRWEDAQVLLDAGVDVLTSLNIQHMESLNDQVFQVTGVRVRETIPDWVVQSADEIVMVDLTPRALLHRLERGVIYGPEKAKQAMDHFFIEANLTALRELALRQTAHHVEEFRQQPEQDRSERILLWLTDDPRTAMLIRRGRRLADFLHCECLGLFVADGRDKSEAAATIEKHRSFAEKLLISTDTLHVTNAPEAVAEFARKRGVTQILVTRHTPQLKDLVRLVRDMQVTIVSERVR